MLFKNVWQNSKSQTGGARRLVCSTDTWRRWEADPGGQGKLLRKVDTSLAAFVSCKLVTLVEKCGEGGEVCRNILNCDLVCVCRGRDGPKVTPKRCVLTRRVKAVCFILEEVEVIGTVARYRYKR